MTIAYWTLYRLARNHVGLVKRASWQWYLQHAYQTVVGMMTNASYYTQFGLMEGTVFTALLQDLQSEPGFETQAANMLGLMRSRAVAWSQEAAPYGSEAPWDNTGQEEVYAWEKYFGYTQQAQNALDTIYGFDPSVPGWGYNGNVHRYWDFGTAGKIAGYERMGYHYAATLNAIPMFDDFRANPSDLYELRLAYAGFLGGATNIQQDGFGSIAFHTYPWYLQWDPYSGDYGVGYFGHSYEAATYVVRDPELGLLVYGGNIVGGAGNVTIIPKDGQRTRLYVAPTGTWIQLEAGKIASATFSESSNTVTLKLDPATAYTPAARIFVAHPTAPSQAYAAIGGTLERGGYTVELGSGPTTVEIGPAAGG